MFLLKTQYFNKNLIIKGLITACLLSSFIYLSYLSFESKLIDTIFGLAGVYLLLTIPRVSLFYTGFFTGLFWCYWMGISLQYYDISYIAPFLLFGIGLVFGTIFALFAAIDKLSFRILMIFGFLFISPFGFNWLKLELIFINSYISTTKLSFFLILLSFYLLIKLKRAKIIAILPLLFTIHSENGEFIDTPKAKIYMPQMYIEQSLKWNKDYLNTLNNENFKQIFDAIDKGYTLVVLPETAFSVALNKYPSLNNMLLELSNEIDIVTGALYVEDNQIFNASYFYSKNSVQVAKKVVLVPFGEEIPLPKFFVDLINNTFYNGASDYSKATTPTDFIIKGEKYRNAICYEGTTDKIFEELNDTKYMIMISNNAWFTPSIEPTLQHLLLKYYSKKYGVTIFHVANGSKNRIYRP
ncbi:apolipoprotein N-acyltransferase [Aliarcobacter trophiarum LMG 25534]|uniref:Apolipoprotein N-acyltransferase n=1 Tax=Aliarcobacter trophiarum LMG 25534 TaxID=1032241 RepID=A0AAD0VN19_9BACT|nr:apolipoprotein N-acyltransferase [Aliarcobacter trophiarum]AXK49425.1 apolipoprotein N-acyltransferase [Aliarcobacter trophiarum LMG 25534]RXI27895.1 apolipoprotein N-acyltransferase [Aliarcobacter trophiarum]RXJ91965.1 apolipoprotein N-acyltransferase [Aliarcobacter trophiarum LMG 25534]